MTPRLVFRREARAEVRAARDWYDERAPGLGLEFARAVDAAIAAIRQNPEAYPLVEGDIRRAILRRFPYNIFFYREAADELVVLACLHHRRDPEAWRARR